ncbi:DUF3800 domain-containing protein [Streptomyces sp. NPDC048111]|uniref:DUF3800 domain-containing protein n=1 Tax=Streptomyces sp. NPDC048111 TaxID=3365500 RepID=UPI0037102D9F
MDLNGVGSAGELLAQAERPSFEWAYVDETGDSGMSTGGSSTYILACVLVPADGWTQRLDVLAKMRRSIGKQYGVRLRDEIKANYLLRSRGDLKRYGLGDGQRRDIYQTHMKTLILVSSGVFAVVIDKRKMTKPRDPSEIAWKYLMQRLRERSTQSSVPIALVHDEGEDKKIKSLHRAFRRVSWDARGALVQAPYFVEDPISRKSDDSYFIQLADLCAYAAYRRIVPPEGKSGAVCNEKMWGELGSRVLAEVSTSRPDGIVHWPR